MRKGRGSRVSLVQVLAVRVIESQFVGSRCCSRRACATIVVVVVVIVFMLMVDGRWSSLRGVMSLK
jgi:hypothetical protein